MCDVCKLEPVIIPAAEGEEEKKRLIQAAIDEWRRANQELFRILHLLTTGSALEASTEGLTALGWHGDIRQLPFGSWVGGISSSPQRRV